jgi:predicted lipoprotein with Yx(FWY)xxD motif
MKAAHVAACVLALPVAHARAEQLPPATANAAATFPAGVTVRSGKSGFYYADARGLTLYALDQRIAGARSGAFTNYCSGPCLQIWAPFSAPAGAPKVGDWATIDSAQGPQWAYKSKPVFTYRADKRSGDTGGNNYDDLWTVIVHVPPAPKLLAPPGVVPLYVDGVYVLGDVTKHALFTSRNASCAVCAHWTPLLAGLAAHDIGQWTVARDGEQARWLHAGKPVFVSAEEQSGHAPTNGVVLRP